MLSILKNIFKKKTHTSTSAFKLIDQKSIDECNMIINKSFRKYSKSELFDILYDAVESIQENDDSIYINLNKNLILRSDNIVHIANNLNIQLAGKRVELQPQIKFNYKNNQDEKVLK